MTLKFWKIHLGNPRKIRVRVVSGRILVTFFVELSGHLQYLLTETCDEFIQCVVDLILLCLLLEQLIPDFILESGPRLLQIEKDFFHLCCPNVLKNRHG